MNNHRMVKLEHLLGIYKVGSGDWLWQEEYEDLYKTQHQINLTESIRLKGIKEPVLLGSDGRIWDGHHRICAALHLGITEIPIQFSGETDE